MDLEIEYKKVNDLIPYANNSRTHSEAQVAQIASSIKEFGWTNPILLDGENGIIAGHGRLQAARLLGETSVPTIQLHGLSEMQKKAYIIADNKLAMNAGWDNELLGIEITDLREAGFDIDLLGFSEDELKEFETGDDNINEDNEKNASLSDRFLIPPFTILNAREGWWQNRKKAWLALGIKSEEGRDAKSNAQASTFTNSNQSENSSVLNSGTSVFDPVLCEIAYRWFCPENGLILDPFAGGSVRGIVAAKLNRQYIGHELRNEQVEANRIQGDDICSNDLFVPVWIAGDSLNIDKTCKDVKADFIFSCPPYADLEVYSDDPKDLSTMDYKDFKSVYFEIIKKSCAQLKENRFACFVVGDVRDKKGNYYNFVGDTIKAFLDAGLNYYNEAILVTPLGTVMMQTSRNFPIGRKLGKTHQNILIFVKGDGKKASVDCGQIEIAEDLFPEATNEG
jgi:ParB-like chromosome segregation protein Spo0J